MKIEPGAVMARAASPNSPDSGVSDRAPDRTRDAVVRLILERGPQNAASIAKTLHLGAAGIRRHLDALVADGVLIERDPRPSSHRGRGRPARIYAITDTGRTAFPHAYDDLASTALRYLRATGGEQAVVAFAEHRAAVLADQLTADLSTHVRGQSESLVDALAEGLAESLTAHGYAATTESTPAGVQVCQHHCPVAHVAAQFPELCEAETRAFERVLGTYVQRLATIAHGDGVCTTYVPVPPATPAVPVPPATPTKTAPDREDQI